MKTNQKIADRLNEIKCPCYMTVTPEFREFLEGRATLMLLRVVRNGVNAWDAVFIEPPPPAWWAQFSQ